MASIQEIVPRKKYKLFAELGRLPNGKRDRRTKTVEASGKREALKMAQAFEDDLRNRMQYDEEMFFVDLAEKWWKNYADVELEGPTKEKYKPALDLIASYFESYRVNEIKPLSIVEFFNFEKKEGRRSLETKYKVLNSIFNHAIKWKVIKAEDNPMEGQGMPKITHKQQKDFYRSHEFPILFDLLKEQSEEHQLIVLLALTGGLRRGEIAGIASDVCNFEHNSILIKRSLQYSKTNGLRLKGTKSEDTRVVTLSEKLMKRLYILYEQKKSLKEEMGNLWEGFKDVNGEEVLLLFSNEYGKPYRPDTITQFWNRFTTKHKDNLRKIRFHDLRHSSATYILSEGTKEGLNIKTVQKRLGHKDIKTTMNLYSHVTDQDDEASGKLFDNLF